MKGQTPLVTWWGEGLPYFSSDTVRPLGNVPLVPPRPLSKLQPGGQETVPFCARVSEGCRNPTAGGGGAGAGLLSPSLPQSRPDLEVPMLSGISH